MTPTKRVVIGASQSKVQTPPRKPPAPGEPGYAQALLATIEAKRAERAAKKRSSSVEPTTTPVVPRKRTTSADTPAKRKHLAFGRPLPSPPQAGPVQPHIASMRENLEIKIPGVTIELYSDSNLMNSVKKGSRIRESSVYELCRRMINNVRSALLDGKTGIQKNPPIELLEEVAEILCDIYPGLPRCFTPVPVPRHVSNAILFKSWTILIYSKCSHHCLDISRYHERSSEHCLNVVYGCYCANYSQ